MEYNNLSTTSLRKLLLHILLKWNIEEEVCIRICNSLLLAHSNGHPSHGIQLLPTYKKWLDKKLLNNKALITNIENKNIYIYDAHKTFGHYVLPFIFQKHILLSNETGISSFGINNMGHAGYLKAIWQYIESKNHICILLSNMMGSKLVAPYGSSKKHMSTSCISAYVNDNFCFDMTLASNSENFIKYCYTIGDKLKNPLIINNNLTYDPKELYNNTDQNPLSSDAAIIFDSYKLFNLAILIELICGTLVKTNRKDISSFYSNIFGIVINTQSINKNFTDDVYSYLNYLESTDTYIPKNTKIKEIITLSTVELEILTKLSKE